MFRLFLGLVYSGVIACWMLALMFGIHELRQSFKNWYMPDPKMFGKHIGLLYVSNRVLWMIAGAGTIVVSLVQLKLVWTAVLAL